MKKKKKLPAPYEIIRIYTGKVLFPESLKRANEMIKRSTNLDFLKRGY